MKRCILIGCFIWFGSFVATVESSSFDPSMKSQCMIYKAQELMRPSHRGEVTRDNKRQLVAMDRFAVGQLNSASISFFDRCYYRGYAAWRQGRWEEARNCWYRYLAHPIREDVPSPDKRRAETDEFFRAANIRQKNTQIKRVKVSYPTPEKLAPRTSIKKPRKTNRKKRRIVESSLSNKPPIKSSLLITKAEEADHSGHYEHALRLLKLAKELDPDSHQIDERLREIEGKIN